jgi:hypothetical protein
MLFISLTLSFISLIILINSIFDIRCSCKYRIDNNVDSESSDENFIPTQESSDEQEEQEEQEEETEKPKESFKVDCVENCSKSCLCKTEQQTNDYMPPSDSINKTEQETDDDMPPLVSMNKTEQETDDDVPPLVPMNEIEPVPEHTLRDQIIN